ncbi:MULTISPECIES: hypothetical protein [Brachybacterium]|uniref:Uncharacterized protein n=1 Tax=Brachybacterium alimentarium TaxID=47845 RepID=A0A2A3YPL7_9MICO|nr:MULTISPECIES: hypothetical protein [Brachybacterium]MDN5821902.1 hypothetical protein [Brachybacterium sp.]PCC35423.1 hypothetical protein CIK71_02820 [Brachybacterium alimentarium]PCC41045.1 hypothetical protein CIK66_00285 [Brachybacterium alimentarium]RCS60671.1 hypothetical protein CIK81_16265 [Brachybacterium sp. JB7]RCS71106.1 hypothetical protein CIK73_03860 [Brachybacterium alimentarium]
MALTSKRESKKAKKQAKKTVAAADSTGQKAEKAMEELQKLASTVGPVVSEGAREARSRANDLVDQYGPGVEERFRHQGEKLSELSSSIGPRADKFKQDVQDDYLPRARKTAETTGSVLKAAVDAARHELDKGQDDIRTAALQPTPKKKGRAGKVLLVLGLAAAGAAAGYIAWQKTRPVEDPWAPPADFARAHYPASASSEDDSSTVSDTVGSADAGDVASALKGDDRSSDTAPKEVKVDSDPAETSVASDDEKRGSHRGDA